MKRIIVLVAIVFSLVHVGVIEIPGEVVNPAGVGVRETELEPTPDQREETIAEIGLTLRQPAGSFLQMLFHFFDLEGTS